MLIGLSGFIGSGKDTVGTYLVKHHSFIQISYASSLKDVVSSLFGWDRTKLEGITPEDREWRNIVDTWWEEKLGIPGLTPRLVLQKIGTDLFRKHFHPDIWISVIERKILNIKESNLDCRIVITDCRFFNEGELIKKLGGKVIRVFREIPEHYPVMYKASMGDLECIQECERLCIHSSEYNMLSFPFDSVIVNDGSLDELYGKIDAYLR